MADVGALVPSPFAAAAGPGAIRELIAATYDRHQRELFTFALRACHDPAAAEDLVQEAFTRLIEEVGAGRAPQNVRAWLYRVVANLAVSRGRRATVAERRQRALVDDRADAGPEPAYIEHERHADVEAALGELDVDARTALLMAASGFSGMEIAEAIGRSPNATRNLMCRTRHQLRDRLGSVAVPA